MNKLFTKIASLALGAAMAFGVGIAVSGTKASVAEAATAAVSISDYASAHSWTGSGGGPYKSVEIDSHVTASLGTTGGNSGKYYTDWRLYQSEGEVITISTDSGTLSSITYTYTNSNTGVLATVSGTSVATANRVNSGTAKSVSGTSYSLYVANTSTKTNGQVRITAISVTYTPESQKTATTTTITAANEKTVLDSTADPADTVQLTATAKAGNTTVTSLASDFTWVSGSTSVATVSSTGLVTAVSVGTARITASYAGDSTYEASNNYIDIEVANTSEILFDSTKQGYTNEQVVSSWSSAGGVVTISFSNGKYYTSGTAVRAYSSSTITVSSETKNITSITFTFGSSDGSNTITANTGTWSSPNWTGESSSVQFSIGGSSGNRRIQKVAVEVEDKIVITPTKTVAEWKSGAGTVYNASAKNTLSSADVYVYEKDDNNNVAASHLTGTGFVLKIYKNGTLTYTLDATSAAASQSFTGLDATSANVAWTVKATVGTLTESSALELTVVAKDTVSLTWNNEQTGTFVSYAQKLHINGTFTPTWNDGSNTHAHPVTTEVYTGSSAVEANKIYSASHEYSTHTAGFDITEATVQGKTLSVDSEGRLNYSSATTFYIQMYYTQYTGAKIGKVVNVVLPTLYAEDANEFNYYVNSTYQTAANVSLKYNDSIVRTLTTEFTLNPTSITPTSTSNINITVTFTENTSITTTYSITPKQPASLEMLELYDNYGYAMTDQVSYSGFTAGENFKLYNKSGESYFAYALDSDSNDIYISSYADLTFELLDSATAASGSGSEITTSTFMRKNMNDKWIRATYRQGSSTVEFTYQIYILDATVDTYSEGQLENYYEKVTSLSNVTSGDYIISYSDYIFVANDAVSNFDNSITISNNQVPYSATVAKYEIHIVRTGNDISLQVSSTSDTHAGSFITYTAGSNTLSFTSEVVNMGIEEVASSNFDTYSSGGKFAIGNGDNYLAFNSTSGQTRYRFYKGATLVNTKTAQTAYFAVDLYKRAGTSGTGDKITYLKQVIDAYRLNADTAVEGEGLSICSEDTAIYSSDYWNGTNGKVSVKSLYQNLTPAELVELQVQDKFGETGMTYVDTYAMLISKEQISNNLLVQTLFGESTPTIAIISVAMVGVSAVGGYFFLRRRKEI